MMSKENKQFCIGLLAIVGAISIVFYISDKFDKSMPVNYNPRNAVNGIDTVYAGDSIYTIEVRIKNVEEKPQDDPEPDRYQ